jgi:hypothetical protein
LQKCGFTVLGEATVPLSPDAPGGEEVEEFILRLGANETDETK